MRRQLALAGVPHDELDAAIADLDERITYSTSLNFAARDTRDWARAVQLPTFLYGVHDDVLSEPGDLQAMFDSLDTDDKRLAWLYDTPARWDGYLEFQRRPEPMLAWFAEHMS
ncbi:hypothetical protein ABZ599_39275 [Streptomyces misionensis]|uniref:hypothetical protein n=1 Tax=Streptomyces misionensis TaxID=67331 RepID=UPI0033C53E4A